MGPFIFIVSFLRGFLFGRFLFGRFLFGRFLFGCFLLRRCALDTDSLRAATVLSTPGIVRALGQLLLRPPALHIVKPKLARAAASALALCCDFRFGIDVFAARESKLPAYNFCAIMVV